ncbi:hypothetical protein HK405_009192, partial [Cladochytrium tenue]
KSTKHQHKSLGTNHPHASPHSRRGGGGGRVGNRARGRGAQNRGTDAPGQRNTKRGGQGSAGDDGDEGHEDSDPGRADEDNADAMSEEADDAAAFESGEEEDPELGILSGHAGELDPEGSAGGDEGEDEDYSEDEEDARSLLGDAAGVVSDDRMDLDVHPGNDEAGSAPEKEPVMTIKELHALLQSEDAERLATGLPKFARILKRLSERVVDAEVSEEGDLFRAYVKLSPECAELLWLWDYQQKPVAQIAHEFLLHLCTEPGFGVCPQFGGWLHQYSAKGRPRSATLLKWAGMLKPMEDERQGAALLALLRSCPDISLSYWETSQSAHSFEPRLSERWLANMALVARVLSMPIPDLAGGVWASAGERLSPTPAVVSALAENVFPGILRGALGRALQHPSITVRYTGGTILALAVERLGLFCDSLAGLDTSVLESVTDDFTDPDSGGGSGIWTATARRLKEEVIRRSPDFQTVLALQSTKDKQSSLSKEASNQEVTKGNESEEDPSVTQEAVQIISLRLIKLYKRHFGDVVLESRFDFGRILPHDLSQVSDDLQESILGLLMEVKDFKWWNHPSKRLFFSNN